MNQKLIEIVCKGNTARSPVAELVGNNYLREIGADRDYRIISSGTVVNAAIHGTFPVHELIPVIKKYRAIGENDESFDALFFELSLRGALGNIRPLIKKLFNYYIRREKEEVFSYLKCLGIEGDLKREMDQTTPRPDVFAVIAVDREVYRDVLNIYKFSRLCAPVIGLLSVLATGDLVNDLKISMKDGSDFWLDFRENIECITDMAPKMIDRVIG